MYFCCLCVLITIQPSPGSVTDLIQHWSFTQNDVCHPRPCTPPIYCTFSDGLLSLLHVPFARTSTRRKHAFLGIVPSIWNGLPLMLRSPLPSHLPTKTLLTPLNPFSGIPLST